MLKLWRNLLCQFGFHDFELEFRSAPGVFSLDGKDVMIEGKVERCSFCPALFFTYKDWPRVECIEKDSSRPREAKAGLVVTRPARLFAVS